jgi:hypothetical protein
MKFELTKPSIKDVVTKAKTAQAPRSAQFSRAVIMILLLRLVVLSSPALKHC